MVRFATGRVAEQPARDVLPRLLTCQADPQGAVDRARIEEKERRVGLRPAPDTVSRGQIMADTLVARVTGQDTAEDVNVEVNLVMPLETFTDPNDDQPGELGNYGPIPALLARALLLTTKGKVFLRRLFTSPKGYLVGVDERRLRFDEALASLIRCRDQRCRDPRRP